MAEHDSYSARLFHMTAVVLLMASLIVANTSKLGRDPVVIATHPMWESARSDGSDKSRQAGSEAAKVRALDPQNQLTDDNDSSNIVIGAVADKLAGTKLEDNGKSHRADILAADNCPQNCTCTRVQESLNITCSQNKSSNFEAQLPRMFAQPLTSLTINQSPLRNMSHGGICKLTTLTYLDLSRNNLTNLPAGCFAGMSKLITLILDANDIRELRDGAFDGLSDVTYLRINNNSISDIGINVFTNYSMFRKTLAIELMNNKLSSLDVWPLYLGAHRYIHEPEMRLLFSHNNISTFTNHLGWVYNCSMDSVTGNFFFDSNPITHMADILIGWNLTNEITVLCMFRANRVLIGLLQCPLNCDCVDFRTYEYLKWTRWGALVDQMKCAEPENLKGQFAMRVPLDKFICDLVDNCPPGCKCTQQPSSRTLFIHCQGTQMKTLPSVIPKRPQYYKIQLEFAVNNITEVDPKPYFEDAYSADMSNNQIENVAVDALHQLQHLTKLYLQNNQISKLPKEIEKLNFSSVTELGLYRNPFSCSCDDRWMKSWLTGLYLQGKLTHSEGILCKTPERLLGSNLLQLDDDEFCRDPKKEAIVNVVIISVSSIVGTFLLLFVPAVAVYRLRVWMYRQFNWHPFDKDECNSEDKEFDAFISYANQDEDWVIGLVERLEAEDCRVLFHKRDFLGGLPITENIGQAVEKSKRVICVVSQNYLKSNMCMWEFTATINVDLEEKKHRTIVVKFESLSEDDMNPTLRAYLRSHTYIDRTSQHFMSNLLYSMPQNRLTPAVTAQTWPNVGSPLEINSDEDSKEFPSQQVYGREVNGNANPGNATPLIQYADLTDNPRAPLLDLERM